MVHIRRASVTHYMCTIISQGHTAIGAALAFLYIKRLYYAYRVTGLVVSSTTRRRGGLLLNLITKFYLLAFHAKYEIGR